MNELLADVASASNVAQFEAHLNLSWFFVFLDPI